MLLSNVSPVPFINEVGNGRQTNSVLNGKITIKVTAACILFSNLLHLILGKFCVGILLSIGACASSLFYHVCTIIVVCAKKQMSRIYTCGIIAIRAIMQYPKTLWNRAEVKHPRQAMSTPCVTAPGVLVIVPSNSPRRNP